MNRFLLAIALLLPACSTAPATEAATLRVVCWNIRHARGLDDAVNLDRTAAELRALDPDLVALQEVDRGVSRSGELDIPGELAERLGMTAVFGKNIDYQGGDYGNAVLSRLPVRDSSNHHYAMLRDGEQRGLLMVEVETACGPARFWTTHLDYRGDDTERVAHAGEILARLGDPVSQPTIVCGDFNDRPGSATHRTLTRVLSDGWLAAGSGDGFTFPASAADRRIDWLLVAGPQLSVAHVEVPETDASDHRPILAVVQLVDQGSGAGPGICASAP